MDFTKKSIRIGMATQTLAIIGNFIPPIYIAFRYGVCPTAVQILSLWGVLFATYFFNWWVQPLAYFPSLGVAGTYMSHLAGSVADIRLPAIQMAHKAAGVSPSTPEGDAMAAMGVASTVAVSFTMVTIFTFIGVMVIPYFPKFVMDWCCLYRYDDKEQASGFLNDCADCYHLFALGLHAVAWWT